MLFRVERACSRTRTNTNTHFSRNIEHCEHERTRTHVFFHPCHLGVKFVETLKSLNSLESKGTHSCEHTNLNGFRYNFQQLSWGLLSCNLNFNKALKDMSIMLIQQQSQDPKSPQRIPTRKWKLLYLLALILSLPELFIWKWSISKEKCYLSIGPAKSKNYVTEFQYGRGHISTGLSPRTV